MTFENNFFNHSKEYIFLDNETLLNQRQKIFEKISQKNFDKKNNESLKNVTISELSNFDYFYKTDNEDPKVSIIDKYNYEIKVVNGICKNYEDENIEIRNLTNLDFKSFLNQDNHNLNDINCDIQEYGPIIKHSLGWVACSKREVIESGDHFIIFGNVKAVSPNDSKKKPLIFWSGNFQNLK